MEITCDIVGEPCPQRPQRPQRPRPRPRPRPPDPHPHINWPPRAHCPPHAHCPPYTQPAPRTQPTPRTLPALHTTRPTHTARPTHTERPTHTARAHKQPRPRPTGIWDEAGARSEIKRGSAHSLTPPAVRPETMYFCRYWNSRMTGTAARTAPAAKMPHGAVRSSAAHMYMPTARVN